MIIRAPFVGKSEELNYNKGWAKPARIFAASHVSAGIT
jgi:hypothetical protein